MLVDICNSVLHLRVLSYVKGTLQIHDDIDNDNNNIQDDIYSAVIMTTRSLWEFTQFMWWM